MKNASTPNWLSNQQNGVLIRLHVQPKAARSEICGEYGEGASTRLKVRIAAPPVDGEANKELLRFLKKLTGIPALRIHLVRGETSKSKDVLFEGITVEKILTLLKDLAPA